MLFRTQTAEQTTHLGFLIGSELHAGDVVAMRGDLAAGKTTLTKGIARALGIEEEVTSPTFCLVSEYEGRFFPLYHIDVYRLEGDEDFINIGAEDMLSGSGVCVIEWSEKVAKMLPKKTITISIRANEDSSRSIEVANWPYKSLLGELK